jgi:4-hydroxyphenylpyruvate dioxygenase
MVKEATELEKMNQGIAEEISVDGFDYLEFYVGNALQACYYYHRGFGFDLVGYRGLETGNRDTVSYVLKQDQSALIMR